MSAPAENPLPDDAAAPNPAAAETPPAAEPPPLAPSAAPSAAPADPEPAESTETTEPAADAAATAEAAAGDAPAAPAAAALPELSPAACAAALAERFPALFGAPRALPLKLRIQADIQTRAPGVFTKKSLSIFLHRHTTSTPYLKALVNVPTRHDLDGQPAGEVAEEHRLAATAEVERRRAIVDARRQAERDAQRQAQRQAYAAQRDAARAAQGAAPAAGGNAPPAAEAGAAGVVQAPRGDRPPRPEQRPRHDGPRADTPADAPRDSTGAATPAAPQYSAAELEARRERAALLRSYEASTITRANFCVLKRISEAELEARLVVAREERAQEPRPAPRRDDERGPWRDERGPRPERSGPRGDDRGDARGGARGQRPPQGKPPFKPSR
ncbi:MAG: hypothetical protein C0505_15190 [Leptothrix sp. (in: Bacteria)]|nr:hypothetical protein [Leptothrix sp. (in: b-proteobacteria)]